MSDQELSNLNPEYLQHWITQDDPAEVAFLSAPVTLTPVPSIALSIFQASLDKAGISSKIIYGSFPAIHLLGTRSILTMDSFLDLRTNAEYLFAHLTDAQCACSSETFVKKTAVRRITDEQRQYLLKLLDHAKEAAKVVVNACADRIIHMGARVVAASSIYSQQNGSLAVLKRVKELDPSVITVMGGYNVSGELGKAVLRNYPSVDYVSFGEGDESIVKACAILLGKSNEPMPYGFVSRLDPVPDPAPFPMTADMNTVDTPVYRDFFEETERESAGYYGNDVQYFEETYENVIFLEGSRGCWWGAKRACAFCGLNGLINVYREKTPERLHAEIKDAVQRYPGVKIQLSDNVLSQNMIHKLLPALAEDETNYDILAEIKTNLCSDEMQALARAGFHITQPGIESINDHLLKLMGKGSSAIQNIAIMKYAATYGILPVWNMMYGVPGEEREDFEQMLDLIPLVHHLYPPTRANPIVFMRFSRYTNNPEEYGLELSPDNLYWCCYEGNDDLIHNMGINYKLTGGPFLEVMRQNMDIYQKLHEAVFQWRKLTFSQNKPRLFMNETMFGMVLIDTRPAALQKTGLLIGLTANVYREAWEPVSLQALCKKFPERSEEEIRKCLDYLVERKYMLYLSGKYLALATK